MTKDSNLYLIITEEYCRGRKAAEIARDAIAGGVDIIQMREKDKPGAELINKGRELLSICSGNGVTFIVNDDPGLARELDADGVHLGQEDLKKFPVKAAREMLGRDRIIGVSTHSLEQFREAQGLDIDYIAFGPVFPTKAKDYSIGTADVKKVSKMARKPVFFIGGINLSNISGVLTPGGRNIAVMRAITESENVKLNTVQLKKEIAKWQ